MQYSELLELIDKLDQSSVAYLDLKQNGTELTLSKEVPMMAPAQNLSPQAPESNHQGATGITTENMESLFSEDNEMLAHEQAKSEAIVAPMIGVVYLQASPEAAPYVQVGDYVNQGDVVCIIEAMKLMNEIQAPISGTVTEILVENEAVVEYNQPLIRIK